MSHEARKRCRWCMAAFTARSRSAKACPRCRDELNRVTSRLYWHVRGGKLAKEGWRAAVAEAMRAAVAERRRKEKSLPCPYCGRAHKVDASGYCIDCRLAGLDSLHKATGRTNGWDLPARAKAAVAGGWRGRPVAGRRQLPARHGGGGAMTAERRFPGGGRRLWSRAKEEAVAGLRKGNTR